MIRPYLIVLLCSLLWTANLVAQETRAPLLKFDFTVMATDRLRYVAYVQLKPEARAKPRPTAADFDIIPLRVNSQGRSSLYHYEGPPPLRFVTTRGKGEALAVDRVVASMTGPASTERTLVILVPAEEGAFGLLAIDDGKSAFPAGHARLLNLSGLPVSGTLDDYRFELPPAPRASAPRRLGGSVRVGVAYQRQSRPVAVFDQSLSVSENERLLLVFLAPFRDGADLRTRVVRDQVRVPLPETP
ncbi:hypothetical protein PXH66_09645 [Synoicihabitans lomoniglobus]|uniref:Uncharacterized protein n=1 Tax=Synoicihabitans lomoniglobus TaxID=2909285 RepID=A0AAF0CSA9_9BACT|nr:hypothetical protein PXH66_09645 [Opitutaceae bacterium LMO-M01]